MQDRKVSLRIPDEMRAKLQKIAEDQGRSFNSQVKQILLQAIKNQEKEDSK